MGKGKLPVPVLDQSTSSLLSPSRSLSRTRFRLPRSRNRQATKGVMRVLVGGRWREGGDPILAAFG